MMLRLFVLVFSVAGLPLLGARGWLRHQSFGGLFLSILVAANADCKDGICSIDKAVSVSAPLPSPSTDVGEKEKELVKLGWSLQSAQRALNETNFDVSEAAHLLYSEEDSRDALREQALRLQEKEGWTEDAAISALVECNANETAAAELLRSEEAAVQAQFEGAVRDMLESGWDEVVARRALLAQWTLDQRKALGAANVTASREMLDDIRPKLRRVVREMKVSPTGSARLKPADCIFEVTAANFQRVVFESPVPVILDCYADWCGPCKKLGPLLEKASVESGGAFRLAKLNSDSERSLAEALKVTGLPTIFTIDLRGKLVDRAVGMPPEEDLKKFLLRAVTGQGGRIQTDTTEIDLAVATGKIAMMAGMAAISAKQRQQIRQLVDEAVELEGAVNSDGTMSTSLRTALAYIGNAAKQVREIKFRSINCSSKAFVERVATSPAACKLLEVAGFRSTNASSVLLTLVHSNAAVLTLVSQRAFDAVQSRKFAVPANVLGGG